MPEGGNKRWPVRIIAITILILMAAGILFLPNLLNSDGKIDTVEFQVSDQQIVGNVLTVTGRFARDLAPRETVWLFAYNAQITLRAGGEAFDYNGLENTPKIFRSPGSGWFSYESLGLKAEEPVQWTIRSYYGDSGGAAEQLFDALYVGDGSGLYRLMLSRFDFFDLILFCAIIAGIIYLLEGVVDIALGMVSDGVRIGVFGLYCFTGGIRCGIDALFPFASLMLAPPWMASLMGMMGYMLFPVTLAVMIRYYMRGLWTRRIVAVAIIGELFLSAFCLLVQLTGTADLQEMWGPMGGAAFISLCLTVACVALELWRYRDTYLLLLLFTVLPVLISEAVDGVNVWFAFMPQRSLMRYSFSISVLLLTFQLVSYASAEVAKAKKLREMERELTDSRISILLSQVRPHFLYNALVGIKQLCDTEPGRASEALGHFAFYLRGNLDSLAGPKMRLIPFEKELSHVEDYLYLEKMRFPKKLNVQIEIEAKDFMLPPLTVQPIVENAVRHGIIPKENGGTLFIRSTRTENAVIITIHDDGIGFDPLAPYAEGRVHIGIENVRNRLKSQCGGLLNIKSERGLGTTADIILPQPKEAYKASMSKS